MWTMATLFICFIEYIDALKLLTKLATPKKKKDAVLQILLSVKVY